MSQWKTSAGTYRADFTTANAGGTGVNADSLPTGVQYQNGSSTGNTVTVTNLTTGSYQVTAPLTGFSAGDDCVCLITVIVGGVTRTIWTEPTTVMGTTPSSPGGAGMAPVNFDASGVYSTNHTNSSQFLPTDIEGKISFTIIAPSDADIYWRLWGLDNSGSTAVILINAGSSSPVTRSTSAHYTAVPIGLPMYACYFEVWASNSTSNSTTIKGTV
jgi:hypothetical protein